MNAPPLKASEIEALTFIYTPDAPALFGQMSPKWVKRARSGSGLMVAIAWVVVAALAWVEFASRTAPESFGL